jgi:hypothetical protein
MELHEFSIVFTDPDFVEEIGYIKGEIYAFLEEQEFVEALSVSSSDGYTISVYVGVENVPVQDIRLKIIESFPKTSRPAGILRLL